VLRHDDVLEDSGWDVRFLKGFDGRLSRGQGATKSPHFGIDRQGWWSRSFLCVVIGGGRAQ